METDVATSRNGIPMPSQALTSPIVAEPKVHLVQRTEPGRFHARTGCRFAEARSMHPNCKLHQHHATPFGPTFRPRAIRPRLLPAVEDLRAACPVEAAPTRVHISNHPRSPAKRTLDEHLSEAYLREIEGLLDWHTNTPPHSRCPRAAAQPLPSGNIEQLVGTLQLEQLASQLHLLCARHRA